VVAFDEFFAAYFGSIERLAFFGIDDCLLCTTERIVFTFMLTPRSFCKFQSLLDNPGCFFKGVSIKK
jgi:hypothetical protein